MLNPSILILVFFPIANAGTDKSEVDSANASGTQTLTLRGDKREGSFESALPASPDKEKAGQMVLSLTVLSPHKMLSTPNMCEGATQYIL